MRPCHEQGVGTSACVGLVGVEGVAGSGLSLLCLALGTLVWFWSSLRLARSGSRGLSLKTGVWELEFGVLSPPQPGSGVPGPPLIWGLCLFPPWARGAAHLLPVAHADPRLDVGEGVVCAEQSLALVLFRQLPVRTPVGCEGRAEQEGAQPVVAVEVGHPVLELIGVEVRFHISDLDVGLGRGAQV